MNVLELAGLAIGYRTRWSRKVVPAGLDTSLEENRLISLVGPNGTGKSTLLRTVNELQPPLAGNVRLLGRDLRRMRCNEIAQQVAVMLTDRIDPGRLAVTDVVALSGHPHASWSGRLEASDRGTVTTALEAVGTGELAKRMLWGLFDGQRQQVMVAHAIAQTPRLLLLDEPTAFLDPPGWIRIFEPLRDLTHDHKLAVMMCIRDVEVATQHADRLWVVGPGNGMRVGTPHELAHDGTLEAAFGGGVGFDPDSYTFVSYRSQPDRGGYRGSI